MTSRRFPSRLVLAAVLLGSCRFQDLTPSNVRHDEAAVQAVVTALYQALGARNLAGLQRVALPAATALLTSDHGPTILVPLRTLVDVPERRNQSGGARIVRTELHTDGDVATDRVVVAARSGDGRREYEASDMLALAHRGGGWYVAQAMFGPWRNRSAP